ncbi:FtsH protease activity modulator HflK [Candidatus Magnetaquicoccus inordinatus]|uniref:FtsH protease activity modulator HflK n=1 Tax=Candidatus Magnetaquicoccus inordinatus TaxID=2496818 RepID=UPI00187D2825|nr:FtsH protease activity modulator HflK [Candidatus Magnetaquicoccus inordinatus]
MPWNDSGGHGPWGGGQVPPQPPDIEKLIEQMRERLHSKMRGARFWPLLGTLIVLLWMATGIYLVAPDEKGVVMRFGRYIETTDSGPHYHLPYPIETVYTPKVTQVQRIEIGYRTRGRTTVSVAEEALMLTGDENIIDINLSVQYRMEEAGAANFLFNVKNPSSDPNMLVRNASEASIRQVIGRNSIDTALTAGKEKIQADTKQTLQNILDSYRSGLRVIAVQLQQVAPPEEVIHAFKDVASAREDRERAINEAEGYANDILPKAKGEAAKQIQEAEAYKTAKQTKAEGDVHRFLSLLNEYTKAKDITRTRLYLETMEKILPDINKMVLQPGVHQGVLPYLPLPGRHTSATEKGVGQ